MPDWPVDGWPEGEGGGWPGAGGGGWPGGYPDWMIPSSPGPYPIPGAPGPDGGHNQDGETPSSRPPRLCDLKKLLRIAKIKNGKLKYRP
jgi:hypothetical protein